MRGSLAVPRPRHDRVRARQARRYEAHLCVRNNFTTLECATLRGDGDSVSVHVAKKPGGSTVVSDVAFRLPRAGAGANSASDVLTQTIHVSNRGSSTVSVAKPYVGALECGGDGSHAGYYVQPCGSFELARGRQATHRRVPAREGGGDGGGARRVDETRHGGDVAGRRDLIPHRAAQSVGTIRHRRVRRGGARREIGVFVARRRRRLARRRRGRRVARVAGTDPVDRPDDTNRRGSRRSGDEDETVPRRRGRDDRDGGEGERRGGERGGGGGGARGGERGASDGASDGAARCFARDTARRGVFDVPCGEG